MVAVSRSTRTSTRRCRWPHVAAGLGVLVALAVGAIPLLGACTPPREAVSAEALRRSGGAMSEETEAQWEHIAQQRQADWEGR